MSEATIIAKNYGIPVNQIRKDFGENISIVQRFGTANRVQFLKSSAVARVYGLDIQKVNSLFGNQLDTFEATTELAGKMNALYGTQIDSYRLLMESDPTKRMVMIGKAMLDQQKSWDNLTWAEKRNAAQMMQTDEETAALILSKKNLTKSTNQMEKAINAELKDQKIMEKANKDWDHSISNLKRNLLDLKVQFMQVFNAIGDKFLQVVNQFTGGKTTMASIAGDIEGSFGSVKKAIESIDAKELADDIKDLIKGIKDFIGTASDARNSLDEILSPSNVLFADKLASEMQKGIFNKEKAGDFLRAINENKDVADMMKRRSGMSSAAFVRKMEEIKSISTGVAIRPRGAAVPLPQKQTSGNLMESAGIKPMNAIGQSQETTIHNHIYLDGKQISESIVRQSRQ
jgi:hypothetical protein